MPSNGSRRCRTPSIATWLVELEYIGTKGTHLGVVDQPNRASPGASLLNAQTLLPIPYATTFNYQTAGANSSYQCGTGTPDPPVQSRAFRRLRCTLTPSRSTMRRASADRAELPSSSSIICTWSAALSTFDQRHKLSLTFVLSSPVGVHGMMRNGGWKTTALTGWTLPAPTRSTRGRRSPRAWRATSPTSAVRRHSAPDELRPPARTSTPEIIRTSICWRSPRRCPACTAMPAAIPSPDPSSRPSILSLNRALPARRIAPPDPVAPGANNAFNHVVITGYRHHHQRQYLRVADRGIRHPDGNFAS